jgi:hypothetical protein
MQIFTPLEAHETNIDVSGTTRSLSCTSCLPKSIPRDGRHLSACVLLSDLSHDRIPLYIFSAGSLIPVAIPLLPAASAARSSCCRAYGMPAGPLDLLSPASSLRYPRSTSVFERR